MTPRKLRLVVFWKGREIAQRNVTADPDNDRDIRSHLLEVMAENRRENWRSLPNYSVDVYPEGERYTPLRTARFEAKP